MKKYIHVYIMVIAIALFLPIFLFADPVSVAEIDGAPLDGGLSLLIVTGAGYGLKKLKERKAVASCKEGR